MSLNGNSPRKPWRVDKHIPIAVIVMLALNAAAIVFYGGQMDERITNVENRLTKNEASIKAIETTNNLLGNRLTRIETILERIDRRLDRSEDRPDQ